MAVTGVFNADFSSFFDAVKQSELHLKDLTTDAAKVETGLSRMADSFSGKKVIQEATQMAEVFERAGGASAFTEKELARMGATGAEAVAKLTALGKDVPPGITAIATASADATKQQQALLDSIGASGGRIGEFGTAAGAASGKVEGLTSTYHQFDGVLQAAGINIGPQIKGLEDISAAAGKTTGQIGALGTAGLAAGAFMTGWKIGEFIDGLTGASTAVENLTRNVFGLGDAAAETAGAKMDTINRALALGAEAGIKYLDAVKFIPEQQKKNADATINWTEKLADAHRQVRNLTDAQEAEIAIAVQAGATTEQLTNKYGLNAVALGLLAEKTDTATAAQEKLNAERAKDLADKEARNKSNQEGIDLMERDARLAADRARFDEEQLAITNKKLEAGKGFVAQMGEVARVNKEAADLEKTLATEQANVDKENQKLIASFTAAGAAAAEGNTAATDGAKATAQAYVGVTQQVELSSDAIRAWIALMQYTNKANAILSRNSLFTTAGQLEEIAKIPIPSFATGVENFGGGLAKVHGGEVLMNLPRGTSVVPRGVGGLNMSNVFNLVDTESNLARRVSEMIMRSVRAGTQLGTA